MPIRFDPDTAPSPTEEWMGRYRPFLTSDSPHQECLRRADEQDCSIESACDCPDAGPCDKECCR